MSDPNYWAISLLCSPYYRLQSSNREDKDWYRYAAYAKTRFKPPSLHRLVLVAPPGTHHRPPPPRRRLPPSPTPPRNTHPLPSDRQEQSSSEVTKHPHPPPHPRTPNTSELLAASSTPIDVVGDTLLRQHTLFTITSVPCIIARQKEGLGAIGYARYGMACSQASTPPRAGSGQEEDENGERPRSPRRSKHPYS